MLKVAAIVLAVQAVVASAIPADPVLGVYSKGLRYDYLETDAGELQLVDNWIKLSDYNSAARYNPDVSNVYHLFTRQNPSLSQVLVINNVGTVQNSNFDPSKLTVILMHGFAGSATSGFNTVLVPAYLAAIDCNVIILDWSAGSIWGPRAQDAGAAGGRFVNWLMSTTGLRSDDVTAVGFSVGGQGVGHLGRTMDRLPGHIISCDPAERWDDNELITAADGRSVEILHTSVGEIGIGPPLGHLDFYPNEGSLMPGCLTSLCNHDRSFHYLAESVRSGGFLSRECDDYRQAILGRCAGATINMGGIRPKLGRTGIFHLRTNRNSPFSQS